MDAWTYGIKIVPDSAAWTIDGKISPKAHRLSIVVGAAKRIVAALEIH